MILDGKYIVVYKTQLEEVINFLYSEGYEFQYIDKDDIINGLYEQFKLKMSEFIIIAEIGKYLHFWWDNYHAENMYDRKFLDINKIIQIKSREEKLKRILK